MNLFRFIIARPVYPLVFWALVVTLGVMGYSGIPRDLFPDTTPPQVAVVTTMRGASAHDINRLITSLLDREIKGITGLKKVTAVSRDEISSINAEFHFTKSLGEAVNDVLTAVSRASRQLPTGADSPQMFRVTEANRPLLTLAIRPLDPKKYDLIAVRQIVENDLKEAVLRLPGVGRVDVFGAHEAEIAVRLDHDRLREYDLNPETIAAFITAANASIPGGYRRSPTGELLVRTVSEAVTPEFLAQLPVRISDGGIIRLGDVASVTLAMKTPRSIYHGNGVPAIAMNILKPEGGNSLEGIRSVKKFLTTFPERFPHFECVVTTDQQPIIDKNFTGMNDSLISAIWLTMLIILVMLAEWRAALIVGTAIPLAFLTTLAALFFTDYTLNMVTLTGLIISVGMVVDASIVVVENVYRRLQQGEAGATAVTQGVSEVVFSIFGGTLTTIVVLVPLMFTGGYVQLVMRPLSVTISLTLLGSFLAAMTVVPLLLHLFFGSSPANPGPTAAKQATNFRNMPEHIVNWFLTSISEGYLFLLRNALKARWLVLLALAAFFLFTVKHTIPLVGMELMPPMDTGMLTIKLDLLPGLAHQDCREILGKVERIITSDSNTISVSSVMGSEPGQMSFGAGGQLLQQADIQVRLTTRDLRRQTIWEIMNGWREQINRIPGIESAAVTEYGATPVSTTKAPIEVIIAGRDPGTLNQLGDELLPKLAAIKGLRDLRRQWSMGKPELEVSPHLDIAAQLGMTPRKIGEFLQLALTGRTVTRLKLTGFLDIPVRIDLGAEGLPWINPLGHLFLQLPGPDVDLANLSRMQPVRSPTMLTRENLQQTLSILGGNSGRPVSAVADDVQAVLTATSCPQGYSMTQGGTPVDMAEANARRGTALKRGLIFLILVLMLMFETMWHPVLVLSSVPLALIWGLWGLVIFDKPMCLPALSGFILLGGTIVNNAIILIDFIENARQEGMEKRQALFESVRIRLRPIFITTFSTVIGLFPLTFERAVGLERLSPLGIVASCGLIGGTLMTLVVIPMLYDLATDMQEAWQRFWRKV
jgi:multidrug efflux pump subunit AcrB